MREAHPGLQAEDVLQRVAADDPSRRARVEAAPDEERLVLRLLLIDAVRVRVRVRP